MSTISKFAGRVVCTKAQFDALAEKDPNKEYLVTDDDTYVVAPSVDGTAGQVLKKTATGTEWADESGGGVQADYNQNDSAAPDYIKNRPFYAEVKDITLPVYNGSLTSATTEEGEIAEFTPENVFELGEMVMLKIPSKGVDIITPVLKYEELGLSYIGNIHILGVGDDTGEDYFIYTAREDEQILGVLAMRTAFSNMEVGINIKKTNEIVHKLDKIYLPDGTATETYVDTAISNAITKTLNTEV